MLIASQPLEGAGSSISQETAGPPRRSPGLAGCHLEIPPGPSWAAAGAILSQATGLRPSPGVVSLPRAATGMLRLRHYLRVSRAHTAFPPRVSLWSGKKSCRRREGCALPGLIGGGVLRRGTLKREVNYRHSERD